MAEEVVETFRPTSGRIMGFLAIALVVVLLVAAAWPGDQGFAPYVVWGLLFAGVLAWAAMLRPAAVGDRVRPGAAQHGDHDLRSRWPPIDDVVVRQVLAVRAGDEALRLPGHRAQAARAPADAPGRRRGRRPRRCPYPLFVEDRIHHLCERARSREGIGMHSDEQFARAAGVRQEWAYPEIVALVVTGLGLVGSIAARGGLISRLTCVGGVVQTRPMHAAEVVELAERLPELVLKDYSDWTSITFRGRGFAWVDHAANTAMIKSTHAEREALLGSDPDDVLGGLGVERPPPGSRSTSTPPTRDEIFEILADAWRMTATKKAVAAFDEAMGLR